MNEPFKTAVCDSEEETLRFVRETLVPPDFDVIVSAIGGHQLETECRSNPPELLIIDSASLANGGQQALHRIGRTIALPVVLIFGDGDDEPTDSETYSHVHSFLTKPLKVRDLKLAVSLATRRFQEFSALRQQVDSLRQTLEDRKLVERAKGILMRRAGLDEIDAYQRLRKIASDGNHKLAEAARMIIVSDEAFRPPQ